MAQLEENNSQLKQTIKNLLLQQEQDAILANEALTKTEPIRALASFLEACDHIIPDRVIDTNAPDPTTDHQAYRAHVRKINEDNYPRIIQYMKDKRQVPDTMPIHLLTDHERETQRELAERIVKAFKRQQGMVELTPADQQIISSILSQITIQEHEG